MGRRPLGALCLCLCAIPPVSYKERCHVHDNVDRPAFPTTHTETQRHADIQIHMPYTHMSCESTDAHHPSSQTHMCTHADKVHTSHHDSCTVSPSTLPSLRDRRGTCITPWNVIHHDHVRMGTAMGPPPDYPGKSL
jgi:hypothetical protein